MIQGIRYARTRVARGIAPGAAGAYAVLCDGTAARGSDATWFGMLRACRAGEMVRATGAGTNGAPVRHRARPPYVVKVRRAGARGVCA